MQRTNAHVLELNDSNAELKLFIKLILHRKYNGKQRESAL
jgi:hypothetical protein